MRFVLDDREQRRTQLRTRDDLEAETRIKGHVPRDFPERCEGHRSDPVACGPITYVQNQACSEPAASMSRINVDLFKVCGVALDELNMRKAHRYIVQQGDPQMSLPLRFLQDVPVRRLVQDGLRRVSLEESRSCQFNACQPRQILWPRRRDGILRIHVFNPNRGFMTAVRSDARPLLSETRSRLRRIR